MITIEVSQKDLDRLEKDLAHIQGRGAEDAIRFALNRTIGGVHTIVRKIVQKELGGIPMRELTVYLNKFKATQQNLAAAVYVSSLPLPLMALKPRPGKPYEKGMRKPKEGVSALSGRGGVREIRKGSFIARMKSEHVGVFKRTKKSRLPIKTQYGPSAASAIDERGERKIKRLAMDQLRDRVEHETKRLLAKGM